MRQAALLLAVLLCPAAPALAQVTIDLHALDALPGARPPTGNEVLPLPRASAKPAARPRATARDSTRNSREATAANASPPAASATTTGEQSLAATPPASQQVTAAATPASPGEPPRGAPPPPPAILPNAPPPMAALAPIEPPAPTSAPSAPPAPPPVSDAATSTATAISDGLRVTFGAGQTDLSPTSATAIQGLVSGSQANDNATYNVVAYAAGTPEDPSTARRLSLSRALAVRSTLITAGVGSARIYVRALGSAAADGPADRVDLTVMGANVPASTPASASPPTQPPTTRQR